MNCRLCKLETVPFLYYEDHIVVIIECRSCGTPMAVWRHHGTRPSKKEKNHMIEMLMDIGNTHHLAGWYIDFKRRTIPSHWHCHLRPPELVSW